MRVAPSAVHESKALRRELRSRTALLAAGGTQPAVPVSPPRPSHGMAAFKHRGSRDRPLSALRSARPTNPAAASDRRRGCAAFACSCRSSSICRHRRLRFHPADRQDASRRLRHIRSRASPGRPRHRGRLLRVGSISSWFPWSGIDRARAPPGDGGRLLRSRARLPTNSPRCGGWVHAWSASPSTVSAQTPCSPTAFDDIKLDALATESGMRTFLKEQAMNHWLLKSEPDTFGIDALAAKPETDGAAWDGVRNLSGPEHAAGTRLRKAIRHSSITRAAPCPASPASSAS